MPRRWIAALVSSLIAYGPGGARARPAPPSRVETARAFPPCVPALRSAHMAITGSVGHYHADVLAVAVSPDRARIATARADGVLQIDDVRTGSVQCIPGVHAMALSGDARWAAGLVLSHPGPGWLSFPQAGLTLWDLGLGKESGRVAIETPEDLVGAVSIRGVVAVVGYSSDDGKALLWDHATPRHLPARGWSARPVFSADGQRLLSVSSQGPADLYAAPRWAATGTVATLPADDETRYFPPSAAALGTSLVAIAGWRDDKPVLEVWEPGRTRARFTVAPPAPAPGPADRSESERVITIPGGMFVSAHPGFGAIALSPQDRALAVGFDKVSKVLRYDARSGAALAPFPLDGSWPVAMSYSADGDWLVAVDADGRMVVFHARSGAVLASSPPATHHAPDAQDRSADGQLVLLGGSGTLTLQDGNGHVRWTAPVKRDSTGHEVRLSPSGRLAWSGGNYDGVVFDTSSGQQLWKADASYGAYEARFTPDESALVVAAGEYIRVFDARSGRLIRELAGSKDALHIALSADGKRVAGGYSRGALGLWDLATGALIHDAPHGQHIFPMACAFSPDGRWLVSVETDTSVERWGVVRLWNGQTGAAIDALELQDLEVEPTGVSFVGADAFTVNVEGGGVLRVAVH
jgi:WD40 repeat protein